MAIHFRVKERKSTMKIEVKIDEAFKEPKVIIITDEVTEEIQSMIKRISESMKLTVYSEHTVNVIGVDDIIRIYTANKKVYVQTTKDTYSIRMRLYEMEEKLSNQHFVRISQSEIINRDHIESMDISLTGTIGVLLTGSVHTFASRRYVSKIKKQLGI
jgi:DNA-binding LytR/AlgR family response regulator